ncbi:CaiB/BaiF CoA-transferase family protein [Devosia neptuniae]|jgi:CoA:oxalate CoA-transferase|uniref:CaiB/BaiF CoA transferase family protein n=1 Tax=Devosia TaxID=46913 RepID=UPI0022AEB095|nr:CaiB/BaiF CoA-transferase family protein [Devosia neptuniae]MCZ4346959.1 CaiB/BaiF CoA-transferase family protein [Devosia neptuniae]|tara:strand:- start:20401 stop:21552 length:1152 start_codon:yes stop_codon:yes gene_type:complete
MTETPLLDGLVVIDMCQFLSGPYASLRLQDLGARVIKIERPDGGDLSRRLYLSDTEIGGDSTIFHAINRSKESLALDLKSPDDVAALRKLLAKADVVLQNFRPGVIERLGLDYAAVKAINPAIVYASITGYGGEGPWVDRPGQDLLAQARSGVMWLNGDDDQGPVPFGLAIADMLAGAAVAQGVLAALVRRGMNGQGAHIETSLLEVLVDFQFEVLTTHLNDGRRTPKRSEYRSAHAYLSAPYGVYPTADGYLAIAMTPLPRLQSLLGIEALGQFSDPKSWFSQRDAIKQIIADQLGTRPTAHWLSILEPADIWCAKVLDWPELLASEGFKALDMLQTVTREDNVSITTTRSPLRVNGQRARTHRAAPLIGEQSAKIRAEFGL